MARGQQSCTLPGVPVLSKNLTASRAQSRSSLREVSLSDLRFLAAFFFLRSTLGGSKKRLRRTSERMRSSCTFLLKRFSAASKDSFLSTITCVMVRYPPFLCQFRWGQQANGLYALAVQVSNKIHGPFSSKYDVLSCPSASVCRTSLVAAYPEAKARSKVPRVRSRHSIPNARFFCLTAL